MKKSSSLAYMSARFKFRPTSPTRTTRPLRRHMRKALETTATEASDEGLQTPSVPRYGAQSHRAGFLEADRVGNHGHQVLRNANHFRMVGALRAGTGDAIAGTDAFESRSDLDDDTGSGIAGRRAGRQLSLHDVPR